MSSKLTFDKNGLRLDDAPFQMVGGAMHYFRIHPDLWEDRLVKARQCGLNTIDVYCCWNLHEAREGEFDFSGGLDVERFIRLAGEQGLHVLVRPGPFICSEWDLGGLPAWLTTKPGMRLRSLCAPFMEATEKFFRELLPRLAPLQSTRGGPIIAMQIENEYGGFGDDTAYLEAVRDSIVRQGIDVLLLTSDGANERMLRQGAVPGHLQTVNFRNRPERCLALARKVHPDQPDVVMEYWSGKGHLWGEPFWRHKVEDVVPETEWMLRHGVSLSFYMFHGGTSFGFMSGARIENGVYRPHINSYDTDALLNEAGDPTPKYYALQAVIAACLPEAGTEPPTVRPKRAYGSVSLDRALGLFEALPQLAAPQQAEAPLRMEDLGQAHGFVLYRTVIQPNPGGSLGIDTIRDRAQVFLDGVPLGVLDRNEPEGRIEIPSSDRAARLDILVENLGRVNCGGSNLLDSFKGILGTVTLDGEVLTGWTHYPLSLEGIDELDIPSAPVPATGPVFLRGTLDVDEPGDTFLKVPSGRKGVCWINGFNLGRYWDLGPQQTLFVPGPLLRQGSNSVTVLELHCLERPEVVFCDAPEFDDERDIIL